MTLLATTSNKRGVNINQENIFTLFAEISVQVISMPNISLWGYDCASGTVEV